MKTLMMLTVMIALLGCASGTPAIGPNPGGTAGVAKAGDADSTASGMDFNSAFAQPGATAVNSPVRTERRISAAQAGDSPQLVIGGGGQAAFSFLSGPDRVGDLLAKQIDVAMKERAALFLATIPEVEGEAPVMASDERLITFEIRIDTLIGRLEAHEETRLMQAATIAGSFPALSQIIYLVVQIKSNGEDAEAIQAEAIKEAAKSLQFALAPALKALE